MNAVDMSAFIAAKSDQLNADDLMDAPRTITITKVTAAPDAAEQPVSIHYEGGEGRPWKPCKTMRRILVGVWGKDASKYVGRSLTLYRDPTVAFGGLQVGGIRISHMSDISEDKTVALLVTRGRKAPFKIKPLVNASASSQSSDFSGQLAELETARPDLHAKVAAALSARKTELAGAATAFNLADDNPDPAAAKADELIAAMDAAPDAKALEKLIADAEKHKPAMPDDLQMKLEVAYSRNRGRVVEGAEA
jgi:hypothetical protein